MKKVLYLTTLIAGLLVLSLPSYSSAPMRSMTLGGATGLISIPTARVGWETGQFGLNFGVHYIDDQDGNYLPKASVTLFNKWEIGGTYDTQIENHEDTIFHTKLRFFPWNKNYSESGSSLAIGGNYQSLQHGEGNETTSYQIYLAVTNQGTWLGMPAETSFTIGKTFREQDDKYIDFGIGFNMSLLPSVFQGFVNWIVEYGNFSYSDHAFGANAWDRGVFNTGLRLDILRGLGSAMHWKIDILYLDALDTNRGFGIGTVFGLAF